MNKMVVVMVVVIAVMMAMNFSGTVFAAEPDSMPKENSMKIIFTVKDGFYQELPVNLTLVNKEEPVVIDLPDDLPEATSMYITEDGKTAISSTTILERSCGSFFWIKTTSGLYSVEVSFSKVVFRAADAKFLLAVPKK